MPAIFISHASADAEAAAEIKAWLDSLGHQQVFLDFDKQSGIGAGARWERELYEQIDRCQAVLVLVTPAWLASKWCFAELTQAKALGKAVFPIILAPDAVKVVGPELSTIQAETWNPEGQAHLGRRLKEIGEEIARGYRWDGSRKPWPGIMSFDAEDAAVFFGRDPEIRRLAEQLEARRLQGGARVILMVGPSGSGKSSLMKAGLVPYLARDSRQWATLPPFRPGEAPVTALAKTLAEVAGNPDSWREIRSALMDEGTCRSALRDGFESVRVGTARESTVLVAIDQFEEAFTIADAVERDAFLSVLRTLGDKERALPALVVGTVRSDLLGEILAAPGFDIAHGTFTVAPMPADRLTSVIEGPARVAAIGLEPGLASRILDDVGGPHALPLLAFALRELNERFGGDKRLQIVEYEALGDPARGLSPLENAVRRKAEESLAAAEPTNEQLAALKEAFVGALTRVSEDGARLNRPARLSEIPDAARPLIERLIGARLLTARGDGPDRIVEVAHEALFRAWPELAAWLDEEEDFLIARRQIEQAEALWRSAPEADKDKALLSGLLLERARTWLAEHPHRLAAVREFVVASMRREDAEQARRTRWTRMALAASLAAAIGFAGLGAWAYSESLRAEAETVRAEAERARAEAQTVEAERRAALLSASVARTLADQGSTEEALLLLIDAARSLDDDTIGDDALITFHRALERADQTAVHDLPGQASLLEAADGVYVLDQASGEISIFDASGPLRGVLTGQANPAPVKAAAAHPTLDGIVLLREDLRVEAVSAAGGEARALGDVSDSLTPDMPAIASVRMRLSLGNVLLLDLDFEPPAADATDGEALYTAAYVLDVATGASGLLLGGEAYRLHHAIDASGNHFLVSPHGRLYWMQNADGALQFADFGEPEWGGEHEEFVMAALGLSCTGAASGEEAQALVRAVVQQVKDAAGFYDFSCAVAEGRAVTTFNYAGSGGDTRVDYLVQDSEGRQIAEIMQGLLGNDGPSGNLTWVGLDPGSNRIGVIVNREVFVFNRWELVYRERFPDAPALGRFLGDDRLALFSPGGRRIVVQRLESQRLREAIVVAERSLEVPENSYRYQALNPGTCAGMVENAALEWDLPDGTQIAMTASSMSLADSEGPVLHLRGAGIERSVALGPNVGCLQFSSDWTLMLAVPDIGSSGNVRLFDLDLLRADGSLDDALIGEIPARGAQSAFFMPNSSDVVTATFERTVQLWRRDGEAQSWRSVPLVTSDYPVIYAEPDATGRRLLLAEVFAVGMVRSSLYSLSAREEWMELGSEYKWLNVGFTAASDIAVWRGFGWERTVRLPALDALVQEAERALSPGCRPPQGESARASPCWPSGLSSQGS